jgi:SAM-dependent methyltransferase
LWGILKSDFLQAGFKILDFSPSRSIYRILKHYSSLEYVSTDYSGEFPADYHFDITDMQVEENSFNVIICYHILEHIENDQKAMRELYRILKKGGSCIIQTPFKEGEIYEDLSVTKPEDRLLHFGQKDHIRIYSLAGLKQRLINTGFKAEVLEFMEQENNKFGFKTKEFVLLLKK